MSNEFVYPTGRTAAQVYEELHRAGDYATTEHGLNTEHLYADCQSLLDVGCGRSPFGIRMVRERGLRAAVCDIAEAAWAWQVDAAAAAVPVALSINDQSVPWAAHYTEPASVDLAAGLPWPASSFDAVTCFDVLEHLPPERVGFAIRELCRVAKNRVVITVGTEPSRRKGPGGEELHLMIQSEEWWNRTLQAFSPPRSHVRTERIEARIRRGQPAVSTVFIVELQP